METRPEILLCPNIPKPLHGLNPREIAGQAWWDQQRKIAYASTDYHCAACGIHKSAAKYHKWLEAHELYEYDYAIGKQEFKEIVPLCHSCHNFIHSGRMLTLWRKDELETEKIEDILCHGFNTLAGANLKMNRFALAFSKEVNILIFFTYVSYGYETGPKSSAQWSDWHLIFNDQKYYSKFKNFKEWEQKYRG